MVTAPTALYRLYNAKGDLLYVGVTANLGKRFWEHSLTKQWWPVVATRSVELLDHREDALMAERIAIKTEGPVFNLAGVEQESTPENGRALTLTLTREEAKQLELLAGEAGVTPAVMAARLISVALEMQRATEDWQLCCENILGAMTEGEADHLWLVALEAGMEPWEWIAAVLAIIINDNLWDMLGTSAITAWLVDEVKVRNG